jgi:hypothetical protein
MAKTIEREEAVLLRGKGKSIKNIAEILDVSKSTVSVWCRDVRLTSKQIENLHKSMVSGSYMGRMRGAMIQHEKRARREKEGEAVGMKEIGKLSKRDLLIAFTALYWGEGSKKNRRLFIINSDPEMVRFLFRVFRDIFNVEDDRFSLAVGINISHKKRDDEIISYWAKVTGIPKSQFRKTIFVKTKNKKVYKNFSNYYGMLRINIAKSIDIYYKTMGLIKGLTGG